MISNLSVSRSIDPNIREYLRWRAQQWLAEENDKHTGRELARLAGVSAAQISDAVNRGQIGWRTMMGLSAAFGLSLADLEQQAKKWAVGRPPIVPARAVVTGRPVRRLHDRKEWEALAAAVVEEHGELDAEDIAAVGRLEDGDAFDGPLDAPTVAGFAAVLRARRQRLERRRLAQS